MHTEAAVGCTRFMRVRASIEHRIMTVENPRTITSRPLRPRLTSRKKIEEELALPGGETSRKIRSTGPLQPADQRRRHLSPEGDCKDFGRYDRKHVTVRRYGAGTGRTRRTSIADLRSVLLDQGTGGHGRPGAGTLDIQGHRRSRRWFPRLPQSLTWGVRISFLCTTNTVRRRRRQCPGQDEF